MNKETETLTKPNKTEASNDTQPSAEAPEVKSEKKKKTKKKHKKRTAIIIIVIILVLAIAAVAAFKFMGQTAGIEIVYTDVQAEIQNLSTYYSYDGYIASGQTQMVYATALGTISSIPVSRGQLVEEGDLLVSFDNDASNTLTQAQMSYNTAKTNYDRTKALYDIGAVSKSELESSANSLSSASLQLSNAKESVGDENIYADFSGKVISISAREGDEVSSGSMVMTLISYDELEISINVDEYDIEDLEVGQAAYVTINSTGETVIGYIKELSLSASYSNGVSYFTGTIGLDSDADVTVGVSVEVQINITDTGDVLCVPISCIQYEDGQTFVYDAEMNKINVKIGDTNGMYIEIQEGLEEGQTVKSISYKSTASDDEEESSLFDFSSMGGGMEMPSGDFGGGNMPSGDFGGGNMPSGGGMGGGGGMPGGMN